VGKVAWMRNIVSYTTTSSKANIGVRYGFELRQTLQILTDLTIAKD